MAFSVVEVGGGRMSNGRLEIRLYRRGAAEYLDISHVVLLEGFAIEAGPNEERCRFRVVIPPTTMPGVGSSLPAIGDEISVRQGLTSLTGHLSSQIFRGTVESLSGVELGAGTGHMDWDVCAVRVSSAVLAAGAFEMLSPMEPGEIVFTVGGSGGGAGRIRQKVKEATNQHMVDSGSTRRRIRKEEL